MAVSEDRHGWLYRSDLDAFVYPWSRADQVVSRAAAEANPQMAAALGLNEEARAWKHPANAGEPI